MNSSRMLSRLLPVAEGDVSVFENMRRDTRRQSDLESQRLPSRRQTLHDAHDDPDRFLFEGANDEPSDRSHTSPASQPSTRPSPAMQRARPRWLDTDRYRRVSEEDEDVPESLLLEARAKGIPDEIEHPLDKTEAQWKAAQEQHHLHMPLSPGVGPSNATRSRATQERAHPARQDSRADAMWLYTNASNMDAFLFRVYEYYMNHGMWSILLARVVELLTELFAFTFAMFLTTCIDYSKVPSSKSTSDVMIPKCMAKAPWTKNFVIFVFIVYWLARLTFYIGDTPRIQRMHNFYLHVLGIGDQDIQTVSWVRVVEGLVRVQNANIATANPPPNVKAWLNYTPAPERTNAEGIANRLMRQTNYYVAMYNKDIMDFTVPLPFMGRRQFYSRSLEWAINSCFTNFIFDEQGSVRPFILEVKNRKRLVAGLRNRLQLAAVASVVAAPYNIVRFCVMYFFRYYAELTKDPSRFSVRAFTPFAEWKIREFNELDHLFQRRMRQATPFANDYLKQFPKDKTDQLCRFVKFVSGAVVGVLGLLTLWDSELFLGFEVTPGHNVLAWVTFMGMVWGVAHGALPDENEVHDPVLHLKEVLMFTHYMPAHWKDRLHSNEVRNEFSALYQMKHLIFLEEILSLILAPWILLRNATTRTERIVDFFREQSVHIEGIGYQCNFAVFGFKKDPNAEDPTAVLKDPDGLRDDYFGLKDDKMAASVQNFMQYYSHYNHPSTRQNGPASRRPHAQGWRPPPAWPAMHSSQAIAESLANPSRPSSARGAPTKPRPSSNINLNAPTASPPSRRRPANTLQSQRHSRASRDPSDAPSAAPPISESRLMAQDPDLRDFASAPYKDSPRRERAQGRREADRTLGDDDPDSESEIDGPDGTQGGGDESGDTGGAGVLGMLYQFSKAQAERGTGVGI